jgi:hypothetical protein
LKPRILSVAGHGSHNAAYEEGRLQGLKWSKIKPMMAHPSLHDARLTPKGNSQAVALQATLAALPPVDVVLVSPLSRTLYTAALAFEEEVIRSRAGVATVAASASVSSLSPSGIQTVAVEEFRERTGELPCEQRRGVGELQAELPLVDFSLLCEHDPLWTEHTEPRCVRAGVPAATGLWGRRQTALLLRSLAL